jgi:hypothetical protein
MFVECERCYAPICTEDPATVEDHGEHYCTKECHELAQQEANDAEETELELSRAHHFI